MADVIKKIASGVLSLLSVLPNIGIVNAANPGSTHITTRVEKNKVEKKQENRPTKDRINKHPYLSTGIAFSPCIIAAAFTYTCSKIYAPEYELEQIKNKVIEDIHKGNYSSVNEESPNYKFTALMAAAYFGDMEALDLLLKNGPDITKFTNGCVHREFYDFRWLKEELGFECENDLDCCHTALDCALVCKKRDPELQANIIYKLLRQLPSDSRVYNDYKKQILNQAAYNPPLLRTLLTKLGYTTTTLYDKLCYLSCDPYVKPDAINVLIDANVPVYDPTYIYGREGYSPLSLAAECGLFKVVEILLEHGAGNTDAATTGPCGCPPLHLAINPTIDPDEDDVTNKALTVKCLLDHDVTATRDSCSPLKLAIDRHDIDILRVLLDSNKFNDKIPEALQYAEEYLALEPSDTKFQDIVKLLQDHSQNQQQQF